MTFVHSEDTYISLGGDDLSVYCNSSDLERTRDSHDVTTYTKKAHVYRAGLKDGTGSIGGIYDNTAMAGPRAVIEPLWAAGAAVELIRRPEGTGTGKPQDTVDVIVLSYKEEAPIADMVKWSANLQLTDEIVSAAQPA